MEQLEQQIEQQEENSAQELDFNKPVDQMTDDEVAAFAKTNGWIPPEQFKGGKGKDARTFAKDFEENPKLAIGKNKDLAKKVSLLEEQISKVVEHTTKSLERKEKEYQEKIKEIQAQKKKAEEDYDLDAYKKAENEEKRLMQDINEVSSQKQQVVHPAIVQFQIENEWVNDEQDPRTIMLEGLANRYMSDPNFVALDVAKRMNFLRDKVVQALPDKFSNSNREEAPNITNTNRQQTFMKQAPKKLTVDTLPQKQRKEYDAIIRAIPQNQKDAFTKIYLDNLQSSLSATN